MDQAIESSSFRATRSSFSPAGQVSAPGAPASRRAALVRAASLAFMFGTHLAVFGVIAVGVDRRSLAMLGVLLLGRTLAITLGYHRYLSHRAFKTSRGLQFALALLGATAGQKGPLWWAAKHRKHHRHSDQPGDPHSPRLGGLWHAHLGWVLDPSYHETDHGAVRDLAKYPELVWLDRHHYLAPLALGLACYALHGLRGLLVGFCLSTALTYQIILALASLTHLRRFGTRRWDTQDDSRNQWLLALLALGDGWHNNHHYCMGSARHGFRWWEVDATYWAIRVLAAFGLVWQVREPPSGALHSVRGGPAQGGSGQVGPAQIGPVEGGPAQEGPVEGGQPQGGLAGGRRGPRGRKRFGAKPRRA
jgi:stearoyl-CoA desaturase (Delta-9 desaturase)